MAANDQVVTVAKVIMVDATEKAKADHVSDVGSDQDFLTVGIPAKKSAINSKMIDSTPRCVTT